MKKIAITLLLNFFINSVFSQEVCWDNSACNYAYEGDCEYATMYYNCNNDCVNDIDNDDICDELEISGCIDIMACSYNPNATDDDGSCEYPDGVYDCDGLTCLNDSDGDGICDENEILGCDDENAYNFYSLATDDDGSCWYPVFGCLNPLAGNYNPYADLNDNSCIFSPWVFSSTDCNMTILIPEDADLLIDDYSLEYGDWIGAFYKNDNNELVCGGAVMWKEETTSIAIWGTEPEEDNGFENNEEITWKVLQNDLENTLLPIFNFGSNLYSCNSLGGIEELSIYNQEIYFPPGWTIFSSYIIPIENDIEKVFENVEDIVIIKDQNGNVYWPFLNINQIGELNFNQGYIVKMNYESIGHNLLVSGELVPSDTEMVFNEGWNIISYLNREPAPVEDMMASIEEDFMIIKDEDGLIYWPLFGVNNMSTMYPGRGYQIKMNIESTFSYPISSNSRFITEKTPTLTHFPQALNTGENMTVGIPFYSWSELPSIGDEIAVFSQDGHLIGSQVFDGQTIAISIWGDDISTLEKDGLIFGEPFYFKLWDSNLNQEKELIVNNWKQGINLYNTNSINIIGNISPAFNHSFNKKLFQVFDVTGKVIKNIKENQIGFSLYNDGTVVKQFGN